MSLTLPETSLIVSFHLGADASDVHKEFQNTHVPLLLGRGFCWEGLEGRIQSEFQMVFFSDVIAQMNSKLASIVNHKSLSNMGTPWEGYDVKCQ